MKLRFIFYFLLGSSFTAYAQTAGASTLSTIETLASKIKSLESKIQSLNTAYARTFQEEAKEKERLESRIRAEQQEIVRQQELLEEKIQKKKDEIASSTTWQNRRKSAQSGWKEYKPGTCSAGGPPPICVVDHWYKVSVQEAIREYEALERKELEKVREQNKVNYNKVTDAQNELSKLVTGNPNRFQAERNRINREKNEVESEINSLRDRISQLSRLYTKEVEEEISPVLNSYAKAIPRAVADKHIALLRLGILQGSLYHLAGEEQQAVFNLNQKLESDFREKLGPLETRLFNERAGLKARKGANDAEITALANGRGRAETLLKKVEKDIEVIKKAIEADSKVGKNTAIKEEEKDKLEEEKIKLQNQIEAAMQSIREIQSKFAQFKSTAEFTISSLDKQVIELKLNHPKRVTESLANLRAGYEMKRQIYGDALKAQTSGLSTYDKGIENAKEQFLEKVQRYQNTVAAERKRLISACTESGASCSNTNLESMVVSKESDLLSCAVSIEKKYTRYSNCTEMFEVYNVPFNAAVKGLSDNDLKALGKDGVDNAIKDLLKT